MNFAYIFLFIFSLFSLISAIIEFRLMPNETNRNWKKIVSILTMVMALLVMLFTLYNLTMASSTAVGALQRAGIVRSPVAEMAGAVTAASSPPPA
jgi:hypothetical protein